MQKDKMNQTNLSTAFRSKFYWVKTIVAFTMMLALATSLGFWQLQRLDWKEKLIADLGARKDLAGQNLPLSFNQDKNEFMKVTVKGLFLNDKESFLYTVNPKIGGQGYFVITPFILDDGRKILVNRGFVPLSHINPESRKEGLIEVRTEITGLLRFSEKRGMFLAEDNLTKKIFYNRSSDKIWDNLGLKGENVFVDQTEPRLSTLPIAGEAVYNLPNNHLQYALTWFGLALTLCIIFGIFMFRERKKGSQ